MCPMQVGRTSRAGKAGQSLLLLADFEQAFLRKLQGLPIRNLGQLSPAMVQADAPVLARALTQVRRSHGTWRTCDCRGVWRKLCCA